MTLLGSCDLGIFAGPGERRRESGRGVSRGKKVRMCEEFENKTCMKRER